MNMTKLSFLVAACFLLSCFPVSAHAAEIETLRNAGRHKMVAQELLKVRAAAVERGERASIARIDGAIGSAYLAMRNDGAACWHLMASLELARMMGLYSVEAASANDIGIIKEYEENDGKPVYGMDSTKGCREANDFQRSAAEYFEMSLAAARRAQDPLTEASAAINLARTKYGATPNVALETYRSAMTILVGVDANLERERALRYLTLASAAMELKVTGTGQAMQRDAIVEEALRHARRLGDTLADQRIRSLALGYRADVLERARRPNEALDHAELALRAATADNQQDLVFRWEDLRGRLFTELKRTDAALASYRRAMSALQTVRRDLAGTIDDQGQLSIRRDLRGFERRFISLLLKRVTVLRTEEDTPAADAIFREILQVSEMFRAAELADYLSDPCVIDDSLRAVLAHIPAKVAVLYPILFPDRIEMIVETSKGYAHSTTTIDESRLHGMVEEYLYSIRSKSEDYLGMAQSLYDTLIRPLEKDLSDAKTIVFVADDVLRKVPFGALYNRQEKQFLIERFEVVISPGLTLIDTKPIADRPQKMLVGGHSTFNGKWRDLPQAENEATLVGAEFSASSTLFGADFTREHLTKLLKERSHTMVHIASHAEFGPPDRRAVAMAGGAPFEIDDFAKAIRDGASGADPIELLTLSACETAKGDDRMVLGLAGVAVQAGVRSVLATLWLVHDASSLAFMKAFYSHLNVPGSSRAEALRAAQKDFIRKPASDRFHHPAYWAPYVLIGSWN